MSSPRVPARLRRLLHDGFPTDFISQPSDERPATEGYAVDAKRGRLYMNYEDKDLTTAIDLKTHKTVAKWPSSCGADGPHGISVDQDAGWVFVACSTLAEVLDAGHNGEKLSSIDTGNG